jgi:hypothetical protein
VAGHHQAQRDGNGIVDLPFYRRGARGADMGIVQRRAGRHVYVHGGARPGDIVLTGRPTPPIRGMTRLETLVLVADRAAWRVPVPDPRGRATVEAASGGGDA